MSPFRTPTMHWLRATWVGEGGGSQQSRGSIHASKITCIILTEEIRSPATLWTLGCLSGESCSILVGSVLDIVFLRIRLSVTVAADIGLTVAIVTVVDGSDFHGAALLTSVLAVIEPAAVTTGLTVAMVVGDTLVMLCWRYEDLTAGSVSRLTCSKSLSEPVLELLAREEWGEPPYGRGVYRSETCLTWSWPWLPEGVEGLSPLGKRRWEADFLFSGSCIREERGCCMSSSMHRLIKTQVSVLSTFDNHEVFCPWCSFVTDLAGPSRAWPDKQIILTASRQWIISWDGWRCHTPRQRQGPLHGWNRHAMCG